MHDYTDVRRRTDETGMKQAVEKNMRVYSCSFLSSSFFNSSFSQTWLVSPRFQVLAGWNRLFRQVGDRVLFAWPRIAENRRTFTIHRVSGHYTNCAIIRNGVLKNQQKRKRNRISSASVWEQKLLEPINMYGLITIFRLYTDSWTISYKGIVFQLGAEEKLIDVSDSSEKIL